MRPLVTAHSGCENTKPNSLEFILAAIDCGADAAEIDVRITKDRIPVLSHDNYYKTSYFTGVKSIAETGYADLKGIVSLSDALGKTAGKNIQLNLDIKDFSCIAEVMGILAKTGSERRCVFSGYTAQQAASLKTLYPDAGFMVNISEEFIPENVIALYKSDKKSYIDYLTDIYRRSGGICLNMGFDFCDAEIVDILRKRYVPVSLWTIDDIGLMKAYAKSGVYSVTTRNVKKLLEIISG